MPASPPRNVLASYEQVYVADRAAWRRWLSRHHAKSPGIWLVFDKKSSRPDRLSYGDAVEEALCFGWIDSTVRTLDDARYVQLLTPRKPRSTWSRLNKERVERLLAQGLMAAPGLASIERAKANGSWSSLDAVESFVVPDDLAAALRALPGAAERFAGFSPSRRKAYLHWISQAVRPATRAHRVAHVAQLAASNQSSRHLVPAAAAPPPAPSPAKRTKRVGGAKGATQGAASRGVKTGTSARRAENGTAAKTGRRRAR